MAQVQKIDSNITGLAYAEEQRLGVLGGSPVWNRLEPNSYSDFGGEVVTVAPNPINPSRQRRKGVTTDLNASGGFNHNLTFSNLTDLMQGVMFADIRRKGRKPVSVVTSADYTVADATGIVVGSLIKGIGFANNANNQFRVVTTVTGNDIEVGAGLLTAETAPSGAVIDVVGMKTAAGDIDVDVSAGLPALTSVSLDFTTLGLVPGQWIYIGGDNGIDRFSSAENNGFKRIREVSANRIVIDKSFQEMVTEANTAQEVLIFFGDVLRNETGALIKRRTYHVERLLGAPDDTSPNVQSEVLKGAAANEFTLNIPSAELVNVDFSFIATDNEQRPATAGPMQTNVKSPISAKEYNTSSDVGRIRLSTVSQSQAAPAALFAYVTEATISINNNVTANKAVGVLGAFDVTAGTFSVSGDLTAYFSSVAATQAVRTNADVTLDVSFVKDNTGIVFDMPLISLGDGRLNVEVDQPITLPLSTDAASGQDVAQVLDHTLLITYFNYLPNAAM